MEKRRIFYIVILIISVLITTIYIINNKTENYTISNIDSYIKNTSYNSNNKVKEDFLLVLEIDKLNLIYGIYNKNDFRNNVEYNVEILSDSVYPDNESGIVMLAGHSGTNDNAYFNDLTELLLNDIVYIYFNSTKYMYSLNSIEEIKKDGYLKLHNSYRNVNLILITCKNSEKQYIYKFTLKSKNIY